MYMEMEINMVNKFHEDGDHMVNKFYGDGDHQKNKGHTDSQLCACRS